MTISKSLKYHHHIVIILSILLLIHVSTTEAGASSTPKNLVNHYTHSPYDNLNLTSLNQFQNEYQYRQSPSKYGSSDRHTTAPSSTSESIFEHSSSDLSDADISDYSYQDNRGSTNVPDCKGRVSLNGTRGYITDGPGIYETNLQCTWLIDSGRDNATIRIRFHQFNTECNYDYLYIFDGDSIYSPLVAALSGDIKDFSRAISEAGLERTISMQDNHTNLTNSDYSSMSSASILINAIIPTNSAESLPFEIKTKSGKAFVYFHSDTAQSMSGFYMTYSVNSCPLDCSNKGECDYATLTCKCNVDYYGDGCQHNLCPNNCTSPQHGKCDKEKSCICTEGFIGPDCSMKFNQQAWQILPNPGKIIPPRAFHQAVVVDSVMWIIGGKVPTFSNTNMDVFKKKKTPVVFNYDITKQSWSDNILDGVTGVDHLAELSGHSVAAKGHKIFIYGGIALNNTILDALTVLDTRTNSLSSIPSDKTVRNSEGEFIAPLPVLGHTANIIDGHMYIFLGYNPLYGYINFAQKFNLANNSWSFVERKGSSINGCVGHTSTYDPVDRVVYIYGGYHAHLSNHLYSFDPYSEVWTFLQPGPSPRYYHSALLINRQLVVLGGNTYNTSHESDQCFQQPYMTYDLACAKSSQSDYNDQKNITMKSFDCGRKCWITMDYIHTSILKRHGHSVVMHDNALILFGGFNGILMNDLRLMNITSCESYGDETDCMKTKLALNCYWDTLESKCVDQSARSLSPATVESTNSNCTDRDIESLQYLCVSRESCYDCLNTSADCVWCPARSLQRCQYEECKFKHSYYPTLRHSEMCLREYITDTSAGEFIAGFHYTEKPIPSTLTGDLRNELECKRMDNCYRCHSKPQCAWLNEAHECMYNLPRKYVAKHPVQHQHEEFNDAPVSKETPSNSTRSMPGHNSYLSLGPFASGLLNSSLIQSSCENPCYLRRSCNECITPKCIWCSTTERCVDSSAYFAYHAMGQCMHYVAHTSRCLAASCSDIQKCDECLTNPKCGWLNDISNTGKGKCIEGTSVGPSLDGGDGISPTDMNNTTTTSLAAIPLSNWYYRHCPSCLCNGHSYCRLNSSICVQACQDNTEGAHCERCLPGFFGDPINGGSCRPCRCNGHAQSCDREKGKCYCSTKGIIGHNCNRCDDQNHYIGDPSSPVNGTCYYNLTTDYQYTFNMSKSEDHFYSYINFINVPVRKDSDVDFTIACSRLALVNITSGTSYNNRKPIHTGLECGSFRLRFSHDRHILSETNYSFFVHVYKFQTPFILQIAFSQHRTLYLPQFFFTFSSCFLFFFALSGLIWKVKHEYNQYLRRQRQFIEMEQMASRPFSTVLLEMLKQKPEKAPDPSVRPPEPTPISFEPCFGSNIGVMSLFVQLPGRPNLAIGSALVTLNDDGSSGSTDTNSVKLLEKEQTSVQNIELN